MLEYLKIFIVGISLYFSPKLSVSLSKRCFPYIHNQHQSGFFMISEKIHKHFRTTALIVFIIILIPFISLIIIKKFPYTLSSYLRLAAVFLMLTGTFSRVPWKIIKSQDNQIVNFVEYTIYIVSQTCGTILLIFAIFL